MYGGFGGRKKLIGINIIEETIVEVTENKIVDVEFYEDETIHYAIVDNGTIKHKFMNLKTAEVTEFQGKPSPFGTQYVRVDSSNKSQNLLIFQQSESKPFLRIEIPKRNEFPILNYYWLDENTILIEGDCLYPYCHEQIVLICKQVKVLIIPGTEELQKDELPEDNPEGWKKVVLTILSNNQDETVIEKYLL